MLYLLDTHTLLWWFADPSRLLAKTREVIAEPTNAVMISSVSTWEIVIKKALGKLEVSSKIFDLINEESFSELPVTIAHTRQLAALPSLHQDPFDRLLIAQAVNEKATIITRDKVFEKYPVLLLKA